MSGCKCWRRRYFRELKRHCCDVHRLKNRMNHQAESIEALKAMIDEMNDHRKSAWLDATSGMCGKSEHSDNVHS